MMITAARSPVLPTLGQQGSAVLPGSGSTIARAAVVIPLAALVPFVGLLWLLALPCGAERRAYVTTISAQVIQVIQSLMAAPCLTCTTRNHLQ